MLGVSAVTLVGDLQLMLGLAQELWGECRGDSAYPVPAKLYESVGFREVSRHLAYRRLTRT
jgi:hypothetical protein